MHLAVRECVLLGHGVVEPSLDYERRGVQRRFLSRACGREHAVDQPLDGVERRNKTIMVLPYPVERSQHP